MPSVAISAASSGNNTLVAAVSGKQIVVTSFFLIADAAVTAKFQSGAGGTDLSGAMSFAANGGIVVPDSGSPDGWFATVAGQLLNLNLGGANGVRGTLNYKLVG